jgi:hypothetical protein
MDADLPHKDNELVSTERRTRILILWAGGLCFPGPLPAARTRSPGAAPRMPVPSESHWHHDQARAAKPRFQSRRMILWVPPARGSLRQDAGPGRGGPAWWHPIGSLAGQNLNPQHAGRHGSLSPQQGHRGPRRARAIPKADSESESESESRPNPDHILPVAHCTWRTTVTVDGSEFRQVRLDLRVRPGHCGMKSRSSES